MWDDPLRTLNRLIATTGADARVCRLGTREQLLTMIFVQLAGARSIHRQGSMLASHGARRYHSGLPEARR